MKQKIEQNIAALRQGISLLESLDDALYRAPVAAVYKSTLGGHIRHNLDHYLSFLARFENGDVNYEARERDTLIETSRRRAIEVMEDIVRRLEALGETQNDKPLRIQMEGIEDGSPGVLWAGSSARRELEFLLSHTIHHYALLSVMCGLLGHTTDSEFGVAPSTLRYRKSQTICAR